jgi:hypothetical protein
MCRIPQHFGTDWELEEGTKIGHFGHILNLNLCAAQGSLHLSAIKLPQNENVICTREIRHKMGFFPECQIESKVRSVQTQIVLEVKPSTCVVKIPNTAYQVAYPI